MVPAAESRQYMTNLVLLCEYIACAIQGGIRHPHTQPLKGCVQLLLWSLSIPCKYFLEGLCFDNFTSCDMGLPTTVQMLQVRVLRLDIPWHGVARLPRLHYRHLGLA